MSTAALARTSLLAGGVQAELIPIEELPDGFWAPEESEPAQPRYTAERFFRKRPQDYAQCVQLLAAQAGLLKIARLLHVHHQTVAAVRDREGVAIDMQKERIRRNVRLALEIASERMPDVVAELPASQMPVAMGIIQDKSLQLDGEPTQRIEVSHTVHLTHEALVAQLSAFPEAVEVETRPAGTDSRAGESGQKGLVAPASAPVASDNESGKAAS